MHLNGSWNEDLSILNLTDEYKQTPLISSSEMLCEEISCCKRLFFCGTTDGLWIFLFIHLKAQVFMIFDFWTWYLGSIAICKFGHRRQRLLKQGQRFDDVCGFIKISLPGIYSFGQVLSWVLLLVLRGFRVWPHLLGSDVCFPQKDPRTRIRSIAIPVISVDVNFQPAVFQRKWLET